MTFETLNESNERGELLRALPVFRLTAGTSGSASRWKERRRHAPAGDYLWRLPLTNRDS